MASPALAVHVQNNTFSLKYWKRSGDGLANGRMGGFQDGEVKGAVSLEAVRAIIK
jgi:hypothetical protein